MLEYSEIEEIKFNVLSPDKIRKNSVVEIKLPVTYDDDFIPVDGGLMDLKLGILKRNSECGTCRKNIKYCNGHYGHIELTEPLFNIIFIEYIKKLLLHFCISCSRLYSKNPETVKLIKKCPYCDSKRSKVFFVKPYEFYILDVNSEKVILNPEKIRSIFEKIIDDDLKRINICIGGRPEWLLITTLVVPPVKVRPSIILEGGRVSEDDLTHKLVDIVRVNNELEQCLNEGVLSNKVEEARNLLQYHVATYINNNVTGLALATQIGGKPIYSLVQRLSGKRGIFRGNLMGKRIDFTARSTITPETEIEIDQVVISIEVAKLLTRNERVLEDNLQRLKKYILNFPNYPSILYIAIDGKRKIKVLNTNKEELAETLKVGDIVQRMLLNGDYVLFNRQPSLHRYSIMAHKLKVSNNSTFSLHPSVCNPYNADFDGDEMNLHVIQNPLAQSEMILLANVFENIMSYKNGKPLIAAVKDILSGLYFLTSDNLKKYNYEDVCRIFKNIDLSDPIINKNFTDRKTKLNYSGKEIFSLIFSSDFNFNFKLNEFESLIIKDGVITSGYLNKKMIGNQEGILLNYIHKLYGVKILGNFISNMSKIGINYIDLYGITIGLDEVERNKNINEKIEKIKEKYLTEISVIKKKILTASDKENKIIYCLDSIRNEVGKILKNNIDLVKCKNLYGLITSGSSGSFLNVTQTIAVVGQQIIDNERITKGYGNKNRVYPFEGHNSLKLKGYVDSYYRKGLDPIEYFNSSIAGRKALINMNLKTSKSGYLQRRLINALEDIFINEKKMVVTNSGKVVEYEYGSDGIDITKYDQTMKNINLDSYLDLSTSKKDEDVSREDIMKIINNINCHENFKEQLSDWLFKNKVDLSEIKEHYSLFLKIYNDLKVNTYEPIGVITAQSIGEPATQMNLRTLHHTGIKGLDLTTGLERLIEILDASKNPKNYYVKILPEDTKNIKLISEIYDKLNPVFLSNAATIKIDLDEFKLYIHLNKKAAKSLKLKFEDIYALVKKVKYGVHKIISTFDKEKGLIEIGFNKNSYLLLDVVYNKLKILRLKGILKADKILFKEEKGTRILYITGCMYKTVMALKLKGVIVKTNALYEIEKNKGIEEVRQVIFEELMDIFNEQGLDVNFRHFELLSNVITSDGVIKQIGRKGVVKDKASTLAKASYEISGKILSNAAIEYKTDTFKGILENIIIGKLPSIGTNKVKLTYE